MPYRDRMEIVAQILRVVNDYNGSGSGGGITKTKIMYKTFLSNSQLKEYLLLVTESGMLRYDGLTQTYRVTEKGLKFLKVHDQIVESAI